MKKTALILSAVAILASCNTSDTHTTDNGASKDQIINVVPYPDDVQLAAGTFEAAGAGFHIDASINQQTKGIIERFAAQLSLISGKENVIRESNGNNGFLCKNH